MLPWMAPERDPHVGPPRLMPALLQQLRKQDPLQDCTVAGAKKPWGEGLTPLSCWESPPKTAQGPRSIILGEISRLDSPSPPQHTIKWHQDGVSAAYMCCL